MEKKFSAKQLDFKAGRMAITLNNGDAKEMGLHPRDRVKVFIKRKYIIAAVTLTSNLVQMGEIGLNKDIFDEHDFSHGEEITIIPNERPKTIELINKKMLNNPLNEGEYEAIIKDVVAYNLGEVELTAFIAAIYINGMTMDEAAYLSKKMAEFGEMLTLKDKIIFDKHSIGGVPGNKITFLIVPIVAAAGLTIPKTSSRAITSACGTADIMEVMAPVTFNAEQIEDIVNRVGGIIAWGGGINLAPADDIFIQVEYPLAIDPHYIALCSVMAKKYAVGAKHVVIDLPMGPGTKIKDLDEARRYAHEFIELGEKLGMNVECTITYGDKPVGRAIGPVLEAREALRTLETGKGPSSLIEKSIELAGVLLELGNVAEKGQGKVAAFRLLKSGQAHRKFLEIIQAQGGDPGITSEKMKPGEYKETMYAEGSGYVVSINNRAIVQIARTAGSPLDKGAGILLNITKGVKVSDGDPIYEIYSSSQYKLNLAVKLAKHLMPIELEGMVISRIPGDKVF